MSENLNRSNPDFSKYDSMSIGELEETLRADAMGPERDDTDVDEILYVMEVLAKKRRENGTAGKTALEAYQEFQQHYLPMVEEESKPKRKTNIIPFRRIAAVAASLVLVFSFATYAHAFSFRDVWNAVVVWAQETFCLSTGVGFREPMADSTLEYESIEDMLLKNGLDSNLVPKFIPEGYVLTDVRIDRNPMQETFLAIYLNGNSVLKISVQSFLSSEPEQIEVNGELIEVYCTSNTDYYLVENNQLIQAVWLSECYECYIAGELSVDELKLMIDSIEKG